MRWSSEMSCQLGMLNFNMRKGADLGWMPGRCECCLCIRAFRGICLLCLLKTYGLCLLTAMLSLWCLYCGLAGLVNLRVGSECVGRVGSPRWGSACVCHGSWSRRWEAGARHHSVRAMRLNCPESEGKGNGVSCSVKQVEYKEE